MWRLKLDLDPRPEQRKSTQLTLLQGPTHGQCKHDHCAQHISVLHL